MLWVEISKCKLLEQTSQPIQNLIKHAQGTTSNFRQEKMEQVGHKFKAILEEWSC
jgi:hypothetical protein